MVASQMCLPGYGLLTYHVRGHFTGHPNTYAHQD